LQVECRAAGYAEIGLHGNRTGRKGVIRRGGREHDKIDRAGIHMRVRQRRPRGARRHIRGQFPGSRDAPLMDAGALNDPLVGGIYFFRQVRVGENLVRQIAATAKHNRTACGHEAAPATAWRGSIVAPPTAAVILARS
jgi:hypothetical protein